ncbi:hypothetical protein OJAV_G00017940 [Oryzias javanicus]|uniref:ZZ-type domain-containing protein n=1 Tax=Oryzias javanicus TaxID=123683 RepID=A0A437DKV6_ORYJA|nr:hypothetical protein OJAV_G00017940 [Oryzias javanicus]
MFRGSRCVGHSEVCRLFAEDGLGPLWFFSDVHDVRVHVQVYQTAVKLLSLQRRCYMDRVLVCHVVAVGGATAQQDVMMDREEVMRFLISMFDHASKDIPEEAPEEISALMFRLFDRLGTGRVSACSLQTALVALSADFLLSKYQSLVSISAGGSGSISRSGLRSLLQDLNQVPLAVHGGEACGGVEVAVEACFNGVLTPTASEEHVLTWLQSEPLPLPWLPALFRLAAGQEVRHPVRCHSCKTTPITGLRYRCTRCINVHVCQSCFLTDQRRGKHKAHHPVQEFCSQPTWRESLLSLVRSARHAVLPRQRTQRVVQRKVQISPPSDSSRPTTSALSPSEDPPPPSSSKALQTDEEVPCQQPPVLLTEVRNLQRDKWLLEQQMRAWQLTVQSEHSLLEDRCTDMEGTLETLRHHNNRLHDMLTQALTRMESQQDQKEDLLSLEEESETSAEECQEKPEEGEEQQEKKEKEECCRETTQSFTIHLNLSHDADWEEEEEVKEAKEEVKEDEEEVKEEVKEDEEEVKEVKEDEEEVKEDEEEVEEEVLEEEEDEVEEEEVLEEEEDEVEVTDDVSLSSSAEEDEDGEGVGQNGLMFMEEKHSGICSLDDLLLQAVDRLKVEMEADRWTERQTGEKQRAELLQAGAQVGSSIHHLVDAVRKDQP